MYNFEYFPEEKTATTESEIEPRACSTIVSTCTNLVSQGGVISCGTAIRNCTSVVDLGGVPTICPVDTTSNKKDYDCVFNRNNYPCSAINFQVLACPNNRQVKTDPELRQAIKIQAIRSLDNGATWVRSEFAPLANCAGGERNCTTCSGNTTQAPCTNCTNKAADGGGGNWCTNTLRFQPIDPGTSS